jgi:hypothetical protein
VHEPDHFDPSSQAATSYQPDVRTRTVANSLMLSGNGINGIREEIYLMVIGSTEQRAAG